MDSKYDVQYRLSNGKIVPGIFDITETRNGHTSIIRSTSKKNSRSTITGLLLGINESCELLRKIDLLFSDWENNRLKKKTFNSIMIDSL